MGEAAYSPLQKLFQFAYRVIIGIIDWSARHLLGVFRKVSGREGNDFNRLMMEVHERVFNAALILFTLVAVLILVLSLLTGKGLVYVVPAVLLQFIVTYAVIRKGGSTGTGI